MDNQSKIMKTVLPLNKQCRSKEQVISNMLHKCREERNDSDAQSITKYTSANLTAVQISAASNITIREKDSICEEMKICLKDIHIEKFSVEWENNILKLLPKRSAIQHSKLITSILNEIRDMYTKDIQEFTINTILLSPENNEDFFCLKQHTKCIPPRDQSTTNYKTFQRHRKSLAKKYFLFLEPVKIIINVAQINLPNVICDFKHYYCAGLLTLSDLRTMISNDIKKGSLAITSKFYNETSTAISKSEVLKSLSGKQLPKIMQCITNIFVQQILNIMIRSIDYIIHIMRNKQYCPQIKLQLTVENGEVLIRPSIEEIFLTYHTIIDSIGNMAQGMIPLEDWLNTKTNYNYIKIQLPDWYIKDSHKKLQDILDILFQPVRNHLMYIVEEFNPIYGLHANKRILSLTSGKINFNLYLKHIETYNQYFTKANTMVGNTYYDIGKLEQNQAKDAMKKISCDIVNTFLKALIKYHQEFNQNICREFEDVKTKALNVPKDAKALIELSEYVSHASKVLINELEHKIRESVHMLSMLLEITILSEDHIKLNERTINWLYQIEPVFSQHNALCEAMKNDLEDEMQRRINHLNSNVDHIIPQLTILNDMDDIKRIDEYVQYYRGLVKQANQIDHDMQMINDEETLFRFPETEFPKVIELREIITPFYTLIRVIYQWQKDNAVWLDGPFEWLDADIIQKKTLNYYDDITEMGMTFKTKIKTDITTNKCFKFSGIADDPDPMQQPAPLKLCWQALNDINDFKKYIPLVICMCNSALRKRHWTEMSAICNFDLTPNAGTSLRKIIALDLMENIGKYEDISIGANRELALQQKLSKMIEEWNTISFEISLDTESGMINFVNLNNIDLLLGEHFIKLEEMKVSNFVKPIISAVVEFSNSLTRIQKSIDQWDYIQMIKLSLASIFSYPKIKISLPEEAMLYEGATNILLSIQHRVSQSPNFEELNKPSILESLYNANEKLEKARKGVQNYMEVKRLHFPRLFFLSDKELQEVLFESDSIEKLYVSLNKCFHGINKIRINKDNNIFSIIGDCYEELRLCQCISLNTDVNSEEKWLIFLENQINGTLRENILQYYYIFDETSVFDNIVSFPSMTIICILQIYWTSEIHKCFNQFQEDFFKSLYEKYTNNLTLLVNEMRNCSTRMYRNVLMSVIIVWSRQTEILKLMLDKSITKPTDFEWVAQLRYYLNENSVNVSMFNTTIKYGYEYSFYKQSIINTALTDRCFHTLVQAYGYHLFGAVIGLSATGKTETIKSLTKTLAIQSRFFNCSDIFSNCFLSQIFKGLVSCGTWICFENFDRLEFQILSTISEKLIGISEAIAANLKTVVFEGSQLNLNPVGNITITMSPNQSRYTKLPDNLKVLFRTVSMVSPDIKKIIEVELFAAGFFDSKCLAVKLITLYKILSDQLWCKSCKNFNLCYAKTVIKTVIHLKRNFPNENESMLFLRSLIDINFPKLCDTDLLIFKNIVHDIFPDVVLLPPDYTTFLNKFEKVCQARSLCVHDIFKLKAIQMFEMIYVQQAVMLVSDPFGGKTELLHAFADTLSSLHKRGTENGTKIKLETVVPGVASISQLFGYFDSNSGIWKDGVCSKIFRSFLEDHSYDRKWIIFDGALNDVWIEHLYTVLDTHKALELMSGERISITESTSVFFETMNMTEVSPAILSRSGIIYIESRSIDWRPYVKSHILKHDVYNGHEEILYVLFDWVIDPCLQFMQTNSVETLPVMQLHFVMNTLNLFEMYLKDACAEQAVQKDKTTNFMIWAQAALILSIIWGFGGNLSLDSHVKFNAFCVSVWSGSNKQFSKPEKLKHFDIAIPSQGLIQDNFYIFKGIGNWKHWGDLLKGEKIFEIPDASHVFISTITTMKYNSLLLKHINHRKPFILCGDVSIGKTTIMQNLLKHKLTEETYLCNYLSFTSLDTVKRTKELFLSKLNKLKTRFYGPLKNQFCINFIDDLNAGIDERKAEVSRTLEVLRQYLNYGYLYDLNDSEKIFIRDVMLLLTIILDTKNSVCPRFLRHFNIYTMYTPKTDITFRIFSNILFAKLKNNLFAADVLNSVTSITNATINVYNFVIETMKPAPTKVQYCFNIRDISRVINGCSLLQKESVETKVTFIRLWVHETWRVFGDRMIDVNDKERLFLNIRETVKAHFKDSFETAFEYLPKFDNQTTNESFNDLIFGNFMDSEDAKNRKYEEISSIEALRNKILSCLNEYNNSLTKQINIVVSRYVLECLIKVLRVLAIPGENLLMISSVGSGRKSITKLAAYIQQQTLFEPSVYAYCDIDVWKTNLKTVLQKCGLRKKVTFVLSDEYINDYLLRDISNLLATGEVPDLFSAEDKRNIIELVRLEAQKGNRNAEISIRSVMNYFTEQCKDKLHIVLCFNPMNIATKSYLCTYPELIKYCTINWYQLWPKETLVEISETYIQNADVQENLKSSVINACVHFYSGLQDVSTTYRRETGKITHVTSSAFLHMLKLYTRLLSKNQKDIIVTRNRYLAGLEKLELAAEQVKQMKTTLTILKPQLELSAQQTIATMKQVENENVTVERATILVKEEEEVANKKAAIAGVLRTECEADLAVAIPILEDAVAALNTLKPTDITLVKAMKNPPDTVKLVMAAVCVMLNVPADKTVDPVTGKKYTDYWGPSKRILGDMNFLQNLKEYDKDNIPISVMQVIKKTYMTDNSFRPHIVAKASSAAEGLCKWVRAMVSYDEVAKVVAPKKEKLLAAQRECDEAAAFLNEKRRTLSALNAKLAALNNSLQETLQQKLKLEQEVENCTNKLNKAENLIASLGGEKNRWMQCAENLQTSYDNIVGDMIISCGIIAYMAPYNIETRDKITKCWMKYIKHLNIPYTTEYNFINMLGDKTEISQWYFCGLPKNRFSTENAIIMNNSDLWCLFIDSQNQANQWIKAIENKNDLKVMKITDTDCMSTIQYSVESGKPILIENVGETLEVLLHPFLLKYVYQVSDIWYLDTGKDVIKYSPNFRLYITTRLLDPQYSYETFSKLIIIDFSIPNEALQNKLLDIVISKEKPELQEKFEILLIQDVVNKKILKQQEDNILSTLSSTSANILEDEQAIQTLDSSKNLSLNVIKKQEAVELMAAEINKFRGNYVQFVKYSADLFSTLNALSCLNYMYRFSFSWFIQLYVTSIETSNRSIVLEKRLGFLKSSFTQNLHLSVCRSLSEKHKLLYSFTLCSKILLDEQQTVNKELQIFASSNLEELDIPYKDAPTWLPHNIWKQLCNVSHTLPTFVGLADDFYSNNESWKQYYISEPLQNNLIPKPWTDKLSLFQKLILVKILRPDKIIIQIMQLIERIMGTTQNYSPQLKISQSYTESNCLTPLIFILPSCSSPLSLISSYASTKGQSSKFISLSMGRGQEDRAKLLIQEAQREGGWVFLQNCHLAPDWMVQLEQICECYNSSSISLDFRLWLSSYPTIKFPISVLQNSIKITHDYPLNFKQNLLNVYQSEPIVNKEFFEGCPGKDKIFSKLLFGLCFFHVVIRERKYFAAQGWNIPYDFDYSDLQISITQLQEQINNTTNVPFDTLSYFITECNYGGKIMDKFDMRFVKHLLNYYCNSTIIKDDQYTFLTEIEKWIPQRCEYFHVIKHISEMPLDLSPEIFGSNKNGVITKDTIMSTEFLSSLSHMNPILIIRDESFVQDQVVTLINNISEKLPNTCEIDHYQEESTSASLEPLEQALSYETKSLKKNLQIINNNINNLKLAFDGQIILSDSLKELAKEIYLNKIPYSWNLLQNGIVIENLPCYIDNLSKRIKFINNWIDKGHPSIIYFDTLFSCKMFLTAILLTFSKRHNIPMETVTFNFEVMSMTQSCGTDNVDTYFLHGLHLSGARWNFEKNVLEESLTNIFWQDMPPIRIKCTTKKTDMDGMYECPVYIAAIQYTDKSVETSLSNYIVTIPLKTDMPYTHWIKCITALFCHVP